MAEAALVFVFLLFALAASFVLYALVRAEHTQRETMDRKDAERVARRDTSDQREATGGSDTRRRESGP